MTNDILTEPTALILAGDGYQLTIAPEAETRKQELITAAALVTSVASNDESLQAQYHSRNLAAMRIQVEKSRKAIKEPVNRIGKLIDQTAKNFLDEIEAEEKRITKLVGDHASEVARIKAEKEAAERTAFEAARAAREESERAAADLWAAGADKLSIAEIAKARKAAQAAEDARLATLSARMDASAAVAGTRVADGVRFVWDFEVTDMAALYATSTDLIDLTPRRSAILAWIKYLATEHGEDLAIRVAQDAGLRVTKKPVVSSR